MPAQIEPRKLRWLRIDDDIEEAGESSAVLPPLPRMAIETISVNLGDNDVEGIRSWKSARRFWLDFSPERRPDLVTGDISFRDVSSPLFELAKFGRKSAAAAGGAGHDRPGENDGLGADETAPAGADEDESFAIPTGLSHFKPFAAIARAIGAPIGIAIHTQNPTRWKSWREQQRGTPRSMVALLAAHEIGELAAIMRKDIVPIEQDDIEGCWEWLSAEANDRSEALPAAMRRFREQLASAEVLPADWHRLHQWCGKMERNPTFITDEPGSDPGLTILLQSGERDTISIRSLFADAQYRRADIHFDLKALPPECYQVVEDKEFFELSPTHFPKIGALLAACHTLKSDYEDALVLLQQFPERAPPARGVQLCKSGKQPPGRAHALAVFFRMLDYSWIYLQNWQAAYNDKPWDAKAEAFTDEAFSTHNKTLRQLTHMAEEALWKAHRTEDFGDDEIAAALAPMKFKSRTAGMLVGFLRSANRLVRQPAAGTYRLRGEPHARDTYTPVAPAGLKPGDYRAMGVPEIALRAAGEYVQPIFGHKTTDNHLTRLLQRTFPGNYKTASTFLHAFDEGDIPVRIKEICRAYARDVLNWPEATWPPSIRG